jgi:copper chaperone CopZ
MPTQFIFLALTFFLGSTHPSYANCADKHGTPTSTAQKLPYTKTLTLTGMSCGSCVKNVTTQIAPLQKSLEDQVTIKVDINTVTIDYSKSKNLTEDQLNKITSDLKGLLAKTKYKVVEG